MRARIAVVALVAGLLVLTGACSRPSSDGRQDGASPGGSGASATSSEGGGERISARQAVDIAYAALQADWKPQAKLVFVGRYSRYMNSEFPPFDVEEDPGIGSDGLQQHWVVIFGDVTAGQAKAFYVEKGTAKLVADDLAVFRPDQHFDRTGWVDSTEIKFKDAKRVGLELKTNETFRDVDPDLAKHPLLWLAETSFGRFDVYDATTGEYIKSR